MDECTAFAVGRLLSGGGIFEAFDDGLCCCQKAIAISVSRCTTYGLSRSIVADDQGEGRVKLYGFTSLIVKGADSVIPRQEGYGMVGTEIYIPKNGELVDFGWRA